MLSCNWIREEFNGDLPYSSMPVRIRPLVRYRTCQSVIRGLVVLKSQLLKELAQWVECSVSFTPRSKGFDFRFGIRGPRFPKKPHNLFSLRIFPRGVQKYTGDFFYRKQAIITVRLSTRNERGTSDMEKIKSTCFFTT